MPGGSGKGKNGGVKGLVKTMNKSYQEMTPVMNGIAKQLSKGNSKKSK